MLTRTVLKHDIAPISSWLSTKIQFLCEKEERSGENIQPDYFKKKTPKIKNGRKIPVYKYG